MRALITVGTLLTLQVFPGAHATSDELADCLAHAQSTAVALMCQRVYGSADDESDGDSNGSGGSTYYVYQWLPACPGVTPSDPSAASMSCALMLSCPDPSAVRLSLWSSRRTQQGGRQVVGSWVLETTECRDAGDVGQVRRSLTWQDVESAIRRVGVPAGTVEAPSYTLVNLETTFYTEPHTVARTLDVIGYTVDVEVEPTTFIWHWGDGTTTTTESPGSPYPADDVTHTYAHHTEPGRPLGLSVDVGYTARYRVDGGAWSQIPDTITIAGPSTALPIRQASAVLVEPR